MPTWSFYEVQIGDQITPCARGQYYDFEGFKTTASEVVVRIITENQGEEIIPIRDLPWTLNNGAIISRPKHSAIIAPPSS